MVAWTLALMVLVVFSLLLIVSGATPCKNADIGTIEKLLTSGSADKCLKTAVKVFTGVKDDEVKAVAGTICIDVCIDAIDKTLASGPNCTVSGMSTPQVYLAFCNDFGGIVASETDAMEPKECSSSNINEFNALLASSASDAKKACGQDAVKLFTDSASANLTTVCTDKCLGFIEGIFESGPNCTVSSEAPFNRITDACVAYNNESPKPVKSTSPAPTPTSTPKVSSRVPSPSSSSTTKPRSPSPTTPMETDTPSMLTSSVADTPSPSSIDTKRSTNDDKESPPPEPVPPPATTADGTCALTHADIAAIIALAGVLLSTV